MGLRFRKSLSLIPGLKVNFSKTGASLSLGRRGMTVNIGRKGTRTTVGLPGSGLSYSDTNSYKDLTQSLAPEQGNIPEQSRKPFPWFLIAVIILIIIAAFSGMLQK